MALVGMLVFHLQLRAVCMSASKSMGEYVSTAALMYKSTFSSALLSFDKQKPHFEGITYTIPQNLQYFRYNFGNTISSIFWLLFRLFLPICARPQELHLLFTGIQY
jgi:hypothetical protein